MRPTATSAAAAIVHEGTWQAVDALKICEIRNGTPVLLWPDEFRRSQNVQMKRKRWTWQPKTAGYRTGGRTVRRVPDEQTKDIEARLFCQCGERIDSVHCLHISGTIKI
jgi:hypothetical protein